MNFLPKTLLYLVVILIVTFKHTYLLEHTNKTIIKEKNGTILLDNSKENYSIQFEKKGYPSLKLDIKKSKNGWNINKNPLNHALGIAIDFSNNSIYKINPQLIQLYLKMKKIKESKETLLIYIDKNFLEKHRNYIEKVSNTNSFYEFAL
ncbi:hypothetical protein KKC59_04235, partial [bacterium]|nr:hypothetical protein [bacterium]